MPKHLEQVFVDDPKLAEGLTAFGDFLKTSYFYPYGSHEKCEDERVPDAWAGLSEKFEPHIKGYKYLSVIRVTEASSAYYELADGEKAAIIPIRIASGAPEVSWKPLIPGYVTYVNRSFQVSAALDFVLVTT